MIVDKGIVFSDYEKLKAEAKKKFERGDFSFSALCVKQAAILMYNANLIYSDDELENYLSLLCRRIFSDKKKRFEKKSVKKRVFFYDYFALDNRGLTEQYLTALFDAEYDLFYLGCNEGEKSTEIYRRLQMHDVPFNVVKESEEIERAICIKNDIEGFCPDIILAHTSPWDVAGLVAIKAFEGNCERYLINITDHAFWLGTKAFDFFIEFRNYGYNVSRRYRGIDERKLLMLPYYPIINDLTSFQGFDFESAGKKIVFSGGAIYKIQGSPVFFNLVKHILNNHSDVIFLYLGGGDFSVFENFVRENKFQKRFFYYTERKDIFEIFKRCDIYLNTYPLIGGLMTQYACVAGKLPITINVGGNNNFNNVDELLLGKSDVKIQYDSEEDCERALDFYLNNPQILKDVGKKIKNEIIAPKDFKKHLLLYLNGKRDCSFSLRDYDINFEMVFQSYIKRFNENLVDNYFSIFTILGKKAFVHFPIYFCHSFCVRALRKVKKILKLK
ncbi:MAG: hypothetical protein K5917_02960 [Clostridiales bacterium]|nr:hypothetical protein [Clostridiales bacterium]